MGAESKRIRIDGLFDKAKDFSADEREAFLNSNCNGEADVVAEVRRLLAAHDRAEQSTDFLAPPAEDERIFGNASFAQHLLIGQRVGEYEVIRFLGGGGFGHVYLAFRSNDYRQKVAVKVLRSDIDVNERVLARFELERQLLADLQHDHIVRLHYGGTLATGRPYIVMEYVKGKPITDYCDAKRLTVKERLALFRQVCEAVSYAHRFGAIHRDVKPTNILVDDAGTVKLLDFGIAKMVDPISQRRMVTISEGGMPLTPEYASPEQARAEGISTASDVYSLGVVLYELVTGRRPYDLSGLPWHEVVRVISEVEPCEPSVVVLQAIRKPRADGTDEVSSAETLANPRSTDPAQLNRLLRGDLEQIVLMALRKEPQRRYQTVEALIEDLDRFDRGETIVARQVSRTERSVRWIRRNRTLTALSSAVVVALVAGTIVSSYFAIDARLHAAAADAARRDAEIRQKEAESERASAVAIINFLTDDVLSKASPEEMPDKAIRDTLVTTLIEPAAATVAERFKDRPLIEAAVRNTLAITLDALGRPDLALEHATKALDLYRKVQGNDHPDTIMSLGNYAGVLESLGHAQEAEPLYKQALEQRRTVLGEDHRQTITSLSNYAGVLELLGHSQEAEPLYKQALEQRRKLLGENDPDTIAALNNYAGVLDSLGRKQEAEPLYKQALEQSRKVLGENHPQTITLLSNYAVVLESLGHAQEAEPLYKQSLQQRRKVLGEDHRDTFTSVNNYAYVLVSLGRPLEAEPLFKEALEQCRKVLGELHPDTIGSLTNYAAVLNLLGRAQEAEPLFKQALEQRRKILREEHPDTIASLSNYALVLNSLGRTKEAEPLFKQTLEQRRKVLGDDHADTIASLSNYALVLTSLGRVKQAEPLLKQTLEQRRKFLGENNADTIGLLNDYAGVLETLGRAQEAEPLYNQALEQSLKVLGEAHPVTLNRMNKLAWMLATSPIDELRDGKRSVELATQACELAEYKNATHVGTLAAAYAENGDFDSVLKWAEKSLELLRDDGDPNLREQFSQALENYKAKKPMRQEIPHATPQTPNNEKSPESAVDSSQKKDAAIDGSDSPTGQK